MTPEEAAQVKLAEDVGKLHLVLRPQGDTQKNPGQALFAEQESDDEGRKQKIDEFLDKEEAKDGEPPNDEQVESTGPKWKVEVWQGNTRTIQEFELPVEPEGEATSITKAASAADSANPWLARLKHLLGKP